MEESRSGVLLGKPGPSSGIKALPMAATHDGDYSGAVQAQAGPQPSMLTPAHPSEQSFGQLVELQSMKNRHNRGGAVAANSARITMTRNPLASVASRNTPIVLRDGSAELTQNPMQRSTGALGATISSGPTRVSELEDDLESELRQLSRLSVSVSQAAPVKPGSLSGVERPSMSAMAADTPEASSRRSLLGSQGGGGPGAAAPFNTSDMDTAGDTASAAEGNA